MVEKNTRPTAQETRLKPWMYWAISAESVHSKSWRLTPISLSCLSPKTTLWMHYLISLYIWGLSLIAGAGSGSHLGAHSWYTKEPRLGPRSTEFIFFCMFICLAVLGLSCGRGDLWCVFCLFVCLVVACKLLVAAFGDIFPWPEIEATLPLQWEHGVAQPAGKS